MASLSDQLSVVSQNLSVLSQSVSVISAGLGAPQAKVVTGIQIISTVALTNVSGLSVSVAGSGAVYRVEGQLLYTLSAAAAVVKAGLTFPGMQVATGKFLGNMSIAAAGVVGLSTTMAAAGWFNEAASGSIVYSVAGGASATVYGVRVDGLFVTSTAGTIQLQAGASTTTGAVHIQKGSYIQAFKMA